MPTDTIAYRGRIAPSPTGYLHLGHARTFLIAAERAAAAGGVLVLRDEDLDRDRARPEYARAMLEDLHWLGLRWDEGPQAPGEEAGAYGPYRQSARFTLYRKVIAELAEGGWLYRCVCSRKDLATAVRAPHAEDEDEPVYPKTCRGRGCEGDGALRFRVRDGEAVLFEDGGLGPQSFVAGVDFGDFVVERRDGVPSYQLACVADDFAMGITEVVRGRDLLRSTARQILLQRALGYPQPAYFHCLLLVDAHGQRLAKRSDAVSLRALRSAGKTVAEVRAMAMGGVVR
ncbi:tRNA glutamyl-Q(34) synthetase GluQRS [Terriglobus sp.]|uniref:tRNA glutamyl-Q(34) synthetase GluQRS n=1 Tax=Terriglobus sp. TaxID=1889013 RepID=UPI003B00F831